MAVRVNLFWQPGAGAGSSIEETELFLHPGETVAQQLRSVIDSQKHIVGCSMGICGTCGTLARANCNLDDIFDYEASGFKEADLIRLRMKLIMLDVINGTTGLVHTCVAHVKSNIAEDVRVCMAQVHDEVTDRKSGLEQLICNFDFNHPTTSVK